MKALAIFIFLALSGCAVMAGEKEAVLRDTMIPLARRFVERDGLPAADFNTNNILKWRVEYFSDGRPGYLAFLRLKTGYTFDVWSDGTNAEVHDFADGKTETYYNLVDAPKEKVEAVKALEQGNKLNKKSALRLATKFFKLQGHKESDFHPPEVYQCYWVGGDSASKPEPVTTSPSGPLPYFEIRWYRKDVTREARDAGVSVPEVTIQVSGITSNLISYHKYGALSFPIGRDF